MSCILGLQRAIATLLLSATIAAVAVDKRAAGWPDRPHDGDDDIYVCVCVCVQRGVLLVVLCVCELV